MIEEIAWITVGFGFGVAFTNWWLLIHLDTDRLMELATEN